MKNLGLLMAAEPKILAAPVAADDDSEPNLPVAGLGSELNLPVAGLGPQVTPVLLPSEPVLEAQAATASGSVHFSASGVEMSRSSQQAPAASILAAGSAPLGGVENCSAGSPLPPSSRPVASASAPSGSKRESTRDQPGEIMKDRAQPSVVPPGMDMDGLGRMIADQIVAGLTPVLQKQTQDMTAVIQQAQGAKKVHFTHVSSTVTAESSPKTPPMAKVSL